MKKHEKDLVLILLIVIIAILGGYFLLGQKNSSDNFKNMSENTAMQDSTISQQNTNITNTTQELTTSETTTETTVQTTEPQITESQSTEIFSEYYDEAENLLKTMTLEEKVGQMFLARYPGSIDAAKEIQSENPGGYILFGKDFKNKTKEDIISELANNQSLSKINLFLGVDEEGGTVVRVSGYSNFRASKFKSPQALFSEGGLQSILIDSSEKSTLLKSLGLNMNLAPVVDVATSSSSFIYNRSYGKSAEETAIYTSQLIKTMNSDGIISSMKHFPGYGDNVDTHTGVAVDTRDYSVFKTSDFLPFISGIKANAPTILVSHNIVNCMDSTKPASLSENVHKILRKDLGFTGLIITDDLAMDAVKTFVDNGEAAVQAVLAGNDLIISSAFVMQKQEVLAAVENGIISEDIIDTAVKRILACKYYYGVIE